MKWELNDLVGASDIAAQFGVGRAAVSNWATRFEDFPDPLAHVGGRAIYSRKQVTAWYNRQFGDRPEKMRQRAEELELQAAELRERAARYDR